MSKRKHNPTAERRCDLCGGVIADESQTIYGERFPRARLAGMCGKCTDSLGGGEYSATAVKVEQRALKLGIGFETRK